MACIDDSYATAHALVASARETLKTARDGMVRTLDLMVFPPASIAAFATIVHSLEQAGNTLRSAQMYFTAAIPCFAAEHLLALPTLSNNLTEIAGAIGAVDAALVPARGAVVAAVFGIVPAMPAAVADAEGKINKALEHLAKIVKYIPATPP